ncbi:hypothetical protein MAHJHV55_54860 [Mycobacterium avium subsp. hominissuis]
MLARLDPRLRMLVPVNDYPLIDAAARASMRAKSRSRKVGLRTAKAMAFSGGVRGRPRKLSRRPAAERHGLRRAQSHLPAA